MVQPDLQWWAAVVALGEPRPVLAQKADDKSCSYINSLRATEVALSVAFWTCERQPELASITER